MKAPRLPSPRSIDLRRWVGALVLPTPDGAQAPALLLHFGPDAALLQGRDDGTIIAVLAQGVGAAPCAMRIERLLRRLPAELAADSRDRPIQAVLVGADAATVAAVAAAEPCVGDWPLRVHGVHLDASGRLQAVIPGPDAVLPALEAAMARAAAWPSVPSLGTLQRAERDGVASAGAFVAFSDDLSSRVPWVVWLVAAVIVAVLVLQAVWGGMRLTATLVRMGGNVPERVMAGETWRLWTAGWLHDGPGHAIANLYGLLVTAPLLARALGPSRFVVLYLGSLVGSEALAALGEPTQVGVGASGGIFGLIGALLAATWSNQGMMPPQTARGVRWFVALFALLQIAASFGPHVDLRAHVGGLAVGALLVLGRVVTLGQARPWRGDPGRGWSHGLARIVALAGVVGTGLAAQQALTIGDPAALLAGRDVRAAIGDSGLHMLVPAGAQTRVESAPDGDFTAYSFGTRTFDALVVTVWLRPLEASVADDARQAWVEQRHGQLVAAEPIEHLRKAPSIVEVGGRPWVFLDQDRGEMSLPRWVGVVGAWEVDVQLTLAPEARQACFGDVERFVRSVDLVTPRN